MNRILDRRIRFDQKSRNFRAVPQGDNTLPYRSYTWPLDVWLNQGQQGACVAFGIGHELAAVPTRVIGLTNDFCFKLYDEAKKHDIWAGEDYEGTSVLAGLKVAQMWGWIGEYRWGFSLADNIRMVGNFGPVVLGLNWKTGMWEADSNGFIHNTGRLEGGHCICQVGQKLVFKEKGKRNDSSNIDLEKSYAILHNSWGKDSFGPNGRAKISLVDLEDLLYEDGECAIPTKRFKKPNLITL